jgi:hypothetical protein
MPRIAEVLFAISDEETRFARRGFRLPPAPVREHLEEVGRSFVTGYRLALADPRPESLADGLERVAASYRGFAYEGAAMGVVLTDFVAPWRRPRLPAFLTGPAVPHTYLAHVGIGWAWARLPVRLSPRLAALDPLTRWLAVDGYGFHEGYFHPRRSVGRQLVPRRVAGYGRRAFDQGLGRSLWFSQGARVEAIATVVATFAHPSLERISAWISSVGASVALADLDGDGLYAEVCHVDPRVDRVIVSPAPGTPQRFAPFALGDAPAAGIAPMGCLPGDLDENGREDLLVYFWGRPPVAFLRTGDGPLAPAAFRAVDVARPLASAGSPTRSPAPTSTATAGSTW